MGEQLLYGLERVNSYIVVLKRQTIAAVDVFSG